MHENNGGKKKLIIRALRKLNSVAAVYLGAQPRHDRDTSHTHARRVPEILARQRAVMYALTCPVLEPTSIYPDFCLIDAV